MPQFDLATFQPILGDLCEVRSGQVCPLGRMVHAFALVVGVALSHDCKGKVRDRWARVRGVVREDLRLPGERHGPRGRLEASIRGPDGLLFGCWRKRGSLSPQASTFPWKDTGV